MAAMALQAGEGDAVHRVLLPFSLVAFRCSLGPRRLLIIAVCAFMLAGMALGTARAAQASAGPNILMLYSNESQLPANDALARGFFAIAGKAVPVGSTIFTEFLDATRFPAPEHLARMAAFLRAKYATTRLDLVVTIGPQALKFWADNRATLFPSAPIVFVGVGAFRLQGVAVPTNATGVVNQFDPVRTVEMALALQPDATSLVVVSGAGPFDREWEQTARRTLRPFESRLKVIYLSGLPMADLLREVGRLPRDTVVLHLTIVEDGTGEKFIARDTAERVAAAASAPVWSVYDSYLGRGIVGGYMVIFEDMGAEAARVALRVLAGERPQDVPEIVGTAESFMVDWRQLQRWGLSEANLPPGTVVRFKEPSLWDEYRDQVVAVIAVVLVQSLLIVGLVFQARKRLRAEASLRDSEERTSLAVESANLGLWRMDTATYRIWATDTCKAILGLHPQENLTQQSFIKACHPDDREKATRICMDAVARGESYGQEYRVVHPDGRVRWVLDRARNLRDAAGKSLRMSGVVMDITERKEVEEAMRESEERYRNVVETQTELICRYLPDTTLTFVNDAYCRYFGRGREELEGTKFIELIPESARPAVLQQVASLMENPRTETYEHEVVRPDCSTGWQQWTDHVIADSYGRVVEVQAIGRDTTELRRAELEAQEQGNEVTRLTRVAILGELSGALAHELNQPLTAILSNAQAAERLMAKNPVDLNEIRAILRDIVSDDKRAGDVINRLRALMKRGEANLQPLNLNELTAGVLELTHSELIERNIALTTRLTPDLPDIRGDRVQLQQVLLNLIMNACEAMAINNGAERALEICTEPDGPGNLRVVVADRGPGIPAGLIDGIFEPFVTTKAQGLGLGLSICRSIVVAHGGKMWATNNPERGASFYVSLPFQAGERA
jgi:PAS domain S-box-containing protein